MMHAVQDNAHALPRGDEGSDANEPADERQHAPPAAYGAQSDDQISDEAGDDTSNAEATCKDDTRSVAVTYRPADEVGVCLAAE